MCHVSVCSGYQGADGVRFEVRGYRHRFNIKTLGFRNTFTFLFVALWNGQNNYRCSRESTGDLENAARKMNSVRNFGFLRSRLICSSVLAVDTYSTSENWIYARHFAQSLYLGSKIWLYFGCTSKKIYAGPLN